MKDLVISGNVLEQIKISPSELLIEMAVYLYDTECLTMGQAKKMTGLTQLDFQKELSKREVFIKYDVEDLERDLENLKTID